MNSNDASSQTPPPLDQLLWGYYSQLLGVKRRLHTLQAFSQTLDQTTRDKPFTIRNDIIYNMVLDTRDKCVIDLYSLTVAMRHGVRPIEAGVKTPDLRKKGLFFYIREHHTKKFKRTYVRQEGDWDDEYEKNLESTAKRFARVFPQSEGDSPTRDDIDVLCEEFRLKMRPLGRDRNKNRAHVHEGDLGTAKMHSFDELEELFVYAESLLEDLSLLSASTCYARQDMNHASSAKTSENLVDLVLIGYADDVAKLTAARTRDELYDALHKLDDAPDEDDQLRFNDRIFNPKLGLVRIF